MPNDMTIGDFNRDGNIDLAFANHEKQYLTILLGDGKGNLRPASQSPVHTNGIRIRTASLLEILTGMVSWI